MYLDIKTEYSFGAAYGPLEFIVKYCSPYTPWAGIADKNGTWGFVNWRKTCRKENIKPIFGISLTVVPDEEMKVRRCSRSEVILIALNNEGLKDIYNLTDESFKQFYYWPRVSYSQINLTSPDNLAMIIGPGFNIDLLERHSYVRLRPGDPFSWGRSMTWRKRDNLDPIASIDNWYIEPEDKLVYEPFADERKLERRTSPQFILKHSQWLSFFSDTPIAHVAMANMIRLAKRAKANLTDAPMVKYDKEVNLKKLCQTLAKRKNINLNNPIYKERLKRELKLIEEKDYKNYFLVVADLIQYSKKKMVIGPSRGSCAGSLVCYLLGITEIDPIPYGLYFERFIDINRMDLPDIDIDFQDNKRQLAIDYLKKKYGKENVASLGNISRLKPKSALTRFAKSLIVPLDEVNVIKDAIPQRQGGDSRAAMCIEDTFNDTDVGKEFISKYPNMKIVEKIENHASHTSVHASGVLVCNKPITEYAGVNSRNSKNRIAMIDKKMAEEINLLKIDVLGLRTLTIFAETMDLIGMNYEELYKIPLDDPLTYKVFNDHRFENIFQFEGESTSGLTRQIKVKDIETISALTALSRPGPLTSGSSNEYIKRAMGEEEIKYISNHPTIIDATKNTYGVIIYQEQVLKISREYGRLSWKDTSILRGAMSKSLGMEFFDKYKKKFIKGALENCESEEDALEVWNHINTHGSYSFNKAHSIAYGWISYLCAWFKAHHPLEFAVSSLNNAKDNRTALKLLRDMKEIENIKHIPLLIKKSKEKWSVHNGKLLGGLMTLDGIGPAKAKEIIKLRKENKTFPPGIQKHIDNMITPFLYLYPAKELYGDYYKDPKKYNLSREVKYIKDVKKNGKYIILGCLIRKDLSNINELTYVTKRGGEYLDGPTDFLKIVVEDDTDMIYCTINRFNYEKLGRSIAETGKEEKDWYLIYGEIKYNFRRLNVINIKRITK